MKYLALAVASLALVGCTRAVYSESDATAAQEGLAVDGASMEPTLHCGGSGLGCRARRPDIVLVRDEQRIERREIVAFEVGRDARRMCGAGGLFIKRAVALAGDEIAIRDGAVYVNDVKLRERYANGPTDSGEVATPLRVPPKHVFVLGDNRAQSCDSRVWGPLAIRRVVGVAFAVERGPRRIPLP